MRLLEQRPRCRRRSARLAAFFSRWAGPSPAPACSTRSATTHTVALIHPNPLKPERYVVLNTGHTFSPKLFDDLHWYLYPRFGDYAVLDKEIRAIQIAGFFDRNWQPGAR